ncbi:hypothetical protein VNI00_019406 [Paramarasmius palmivorus]|uniref:Aminotransferase-like plant mobile domain-containing protein n=1 Tax=Paramarasmius palmivorus TaxID=297713 RepID=A0AAW0AMP6_9AGAR
MDDGSVRFTVTSAETQDLQGIGLRYALDPPEEWMTLEGSWLAQAHSVFSQLGIHEDDWEDYAILTGFILRLECTSPHQATNISPNVYLFIRPVPRPSDDEAIRRSWVQNEKYFWSFDPLGQAMVPELVRAHLGLPSFTSWIDSWDTIWSRGHYAVIQKLHISEGFDLATTDFVLSLGLPILDVIGDESRFEDLDNLGSDTLSLAGNNLVPRGESSTRASMPFSAKKPRMAVRTLQSTRTRPRLQLRARKLTIKSPGKPRILEKRMNRRRDAQAVTSNRGATSIGQRSKDHRKALEHHSTSASSLGTSRPGINLEKPSSESLPLVEDHPTVDVKTSESPGSMPGRRHEPLRDHTCEAKIFGKEGACTVRAETLVQTIDYGAGKCDLDVPGSYPTATSESIGAFGFDHERLIERLLILLLSLLVAILFM